jgi:YegS/Rv2252/BmrU family lipid kinase
MKICLIVNPNAGRRRGLEVARHVTETLASAGITTHEYVSEWAGNTRDIAAEIDPSEWDGILAVGGDGTLFEVINGLLANRDSVPVPIGAIPVGTGNSFVKDLGVENVEQALEPVVERRTRRVDLGHFSCLTGTYYFINLLGAGFVSNVAERAHRYKNLGALSYVIGVMGELANLRPSPVRLEIDGQVHERNAIFVEICNSQFTGGNMMMAPGADISDGLLDIVVASDLNRRGVLRLLPTIFSGRHVNDPRVEVFRGRSIRLDTDYTLALTPDGEILGSTPIEVTVVPQAIEVFG